MFDPFGLPNAAEDMSGQAEFSLDGDEKYRSVDILPMPSLHRAYEPPMATMGMQVGGLNKPALSSSTIPAKPFPPQIPEVVVVPKPAPQPVQALCQQQQHLEAPLLPLDISIFPLEKCHYFTEKEPEVSFCFPLLCFHDW